MVLKCLRSTLFVSFALIFLSALLPAEAARALSSDSSSENLPGLSTFIQQVENGQAGELRGVYAPELFALSIVQQPDGDHQFVSPRQSTATQFRLASRFGSTGLLAHNYLAGQDFSLLEKGQLLYLVYGDGQLAVFAVSETLRYQALDPNSPLSDFMRLRDGALLTTSELFAEVYHQDGSVVLQTCISRDQELSWGRLFIIAEPYSPMP